MNTITGALSSFFAFVSASRQSERGATATEYALLVGLIALIIVGSVGLFGTALDELFAAIGLEVDSWTP